ncbi:uncharacterized protein LOC106666368 [Cimex lectularius]|uniref:Uncharacterized protein n=1 Tax=Cimex lectularius TaxID=79782 RepID=A0A8I6TJ05_CIMLE|nr:uncharacterized protein LOC106666368 [Cimex lectularius]
MDLMAFLKWLPKVRTFCFAIPLPIGCKIIGTLLAIYSVIIVILLGLSFEEMHPDAMINLIMYIAIETATLIFSVVLLVGLFLHRDNFVKLFLVFYIFILALLLSHAVLLIIKLVVVLMPPWIAQQYLVMSLFEMIIGCYFFIVVHSYYATKTSS